MASNFDRILYILLRLGAIGWLAAAIMAANNHPEATYRLAWAIWCEVLSHSIRRGFAASSEEKPHA